MTAPVPAGVPGAVAPLRLVVLGDSTSFTDASGPQLPDHPGLYPTVAGAALTERLGREVEVIVLARPAMTAGEALSMLRKDRHAQFDVVARADALVVGIGSYDHAPGGVPAVVDAVVAHLRSPALRRRIRTGLHRAYPHLVRATRGRRSRTPPTVFARRFEDLLDQLRGLTLGQAAGVVLGPTSHRAQHYGRLHPRHAELEAMQLALARRHGFAAVRAWELVQPHLHRLNPDGIHWPAEAHRSVGTRVAAALLPQLRGARPRVGLPSAWTGAGAQAVPSASQAMPSMFGWTAQLK